MLKSASRLALGLAVTLVAGCTGAGGVGVPGGPFLGGGPLPLYTLAMTQIDPETGNTSHKIVLDWPSALNAKNYEIQRKFGDQATRVLTTVSTDSYTDATVGAGQAFTYTVRALSGDNKEQTTSQPVAVTVLPAQVGKPTGLAPADNASIGVGEDPTFSWQAVTGANWYYVRVVNGATDQVVWSALTKDASIKFGAESPLKFDNFSDQFQVGSQSSITRGIVYRWTVSAIRGDNADLKQVKAVDVNPSAAQKFSQGG
ncbi:MAG: hypothetical protein ACK46X_07490 [Candidatus Sericytochromatia bacterium]